MSLKQEALLLNSKKKLDKISSNEVLSFYLRSFKGNQDVSQALIDLQDETSIYSTLEKIRSHIRSNELTKAKELILELKSQDIPKAYRQELRLEESRIAVELGYLQEVLKLTEELEFNKENPLTYLTTIQIRVKALVEIGRTTEALETIKKNLYITEINPTSGSCLALRAYFCIILYKNEAYEEGRRELSILRTIIDSIEDDEMWLDRHITYLRTEFRIHQLLDNKQEAFEMLNLATIYSKWIKKKTTLKSCERDLIRYEGSLTKKMIYEFDTWSFIPEENTIYCSYPFKIQRIHKKKLLGKILSLLCESPRQKEELFELVWGIELNNDSRDNHLRATLSALRKILPKGVVRVEDGLISINPS